MDDLEMKTNSSTDEIKTKKKRLIQKPIIIAACILVVAALAFFGYRAFFNTSVVGTWTIVMTDENGKEATNDETPAESKQYFTFNNDNTATISLGTMSINGTWSYEDKPAETNDKGEQTSSGTSRLVISTSILNDSFDMTFSGNLFTGRTLTISNESYPNPIKLTSTSLPDVKVEPDKKFKAVKSLLGTWKNDEQNQTFRFNEDGTCDLKQYDSSNKETMSLNGAYTVDEKSKIIKIKYLYGKEDVMDVDYLTVDGKKDQMIFYGLEYKKVTE